MSSGPLWAAELEDEFFPVGVTVIPCRNSLNSTGDERESLGCSAQFVPPGFVQKHFTSPGLYFSDAFLYFP